MRKLIKQSSSNSNSKLIMKDQRVEDNNKIN